MTDESEDRVRNPALARDGKVIELHGSLSEVLATMHGVLPLPSVSVVPVLVRRWVPELSSLSNTDLIRPEPTPRMMQQMSGCLLGRDYPEPIVHHESAYAFARERTSIGHSR